MRENYPRENEEISERIARIGDDILDEFFFYEPMPSALASTLTLDQLKKYQNMSEPVQIGFATMYRYIHIRRYILENLPQPADRREFEHFLQKDMNILDRNDKIDNEQWHENHLLHHCSVTADQAELAQAAFI